MLAEKYSRAAGQNLDHWDFYMALASFKLGIIGAGIAYRAREGGTADTDKVGEAVAPLITAGLTELS